MGLHEILPPGAGENRAKLRKDIEEYHIAYAIDFDDSIIDTFIARRPDCLAMSPNLPVRTSPFGSMHSLVCRCATVLTEEAMTLALASTAAGGVDGRLAGACPTASWCWWLVGWTCCSCAGICSTAVDATADAWPSLAAAGALLMASEDADCVGSIAAGATSLLLPAAAGVCLTAVAATPSFLRPTTTTPALCARSLSRLFAPLSGTGRTAMLLAHPMALPTVFVVVAVCGSRCSQLPCFLVSPCLKMKSEVGAAPLAWPWTSAAAPRRSWRCVPPSCCPKACCALLLHDCTVCPPFRAPILILQLRETTALPFQTISTRTQFHFQETSILLSKPSCFLWRFVFVRYLQSF